MSNTVCKSLWYKIQYARRKTWENICFHYRTDVKFTYFSQARQSAKLPGILYLFWSNSSISISIYLFLLYSPQDSNTSFSIIRQRFVLISYPRPLYSCPLVICVRIPSVLLGSQAERPGIGEKKPPQPRPPPLLVSFELVTGKLMLLCLSYR